MSSANADAIVYWNEGAGARWASHADRLDRAFAPFDAAAFAAAAVRPGESILDVGCGCGTTTLQAADAVGNAGRVLGVDISKPMLAVAEERRRRRDVEHATFELVDASVHAFPAEAYDVLFSRFGVMFFDDPVGAFANMRRAMVPGGRLAFACWRDLAANPWFTIPLEAVRPFAPPQPPAAPDAPGPLAFANPGRVRDILERAGFGDVRFRAVDVRLSAGPPAAAIELLSAIGPASRVLDVVDEHAKSHARDALARTLRAHEIDGEVRLGAGVWIVEARRANAT